MAPKTTLENSIEGPFFPTHVVLLCGSRVVRPHDNCGLLYPYRVRQVICEVVRQAGPEAMPGFFRLWVNTILELNVSEPTVEAELRLSCLLCLLALRC